MYIISRNVYNIYRVMYIISRNTKQSLLLCSNYILQECTRIVYILVLVTVVADSMCSYDILLCVRFVAYAAAVFIAEGNQPKKGNCAAAALWTNFTALYDALAQPPVATGLAAKLCKGAIITSETRDVIQTPGMSPAEQTSLLLQAVESSIQIDYTMFRKFIRLLKKLPVLEPIAKQLHHCYSMLLM